MGGSLCCYSCLSFSCSGHWGYVDKVGFHGQWTLPKAFSWGPTLGWWYGRSYLNGGNISTLRGAIFICY